MKTRVYVIALLVVSATMLILSTNGTFVSAQPCTATLSYPITPVEYNNENVQMAIPISASCSTNYGNQLYATGSAYDATSNTSLGTASTVLSSVNGGSEFNGQMTFNLLPASPSDSIQISVTIYNSQGGSPITATGETVQLGNGVQQSGTEQTVTTTVTEGQYPAYNPYPTAYPSPYQPNQSQYYPYQSQYYPYPSQYQPQFQGVQVSQTHYWSQFMVGNRYNRQLFDYIVIIAILGAVIIATTGLVLIARRQPRWVQPPQPLPR